MFGAVRGRAEKDKLHFHFSRTTPTCICYISLGFKATYMVISASFGISPFLCRKKVQAAKKLVDGNFCHNMLF